MKKLLLATLCFTGLVAASATFAANSSSALEARMAKCFRQHSSMMEKPALKNERACWNAHAYLMDRQ